LLLILLPQLFLNFPYFTTFEQKKNYLTITDKINIMSNTEVTIIILILCIIIAVTAYSLSFLIKKKSTDDNHSAH